MINLKITKLTKTRSKNHTFNKMAYLRFRLNYFYFLFNCQTVGLQIGFATPAVGITCNLFFGLDAFITNTQSFVL